jgi:hypothetical protein
MPRRHIITAAIASFVFILLAAPIHVPYSITMEGIVLPLTEWQLSVRADGSVITSLLNHRNGTSQRTTTTLAVRGDRVTLDVLDSPLGRHVSPGDVVAIVTSRHQNSLALIAEDRLVEANAALAIAEAGARGETVTRAREHLRATETRLSHLERQFARMSDLRKRGMASESDFDAAQTALDLARSGRNQAAARLSARVTGATDEERTFHQARVRLARRELAEARTRRNDTLLTSPVSGIFVPPDSSIIRVIQIDTCIVLVPVSLVIREYIQAQVAVTIDGPRGPIAGTIAYISPVVRRQAGRGFLSMRIAAANTSDALMPGMAVTCRIHCAPVLLRQYVSRFLIPGS